MNIKKPTIPTNLEHSEFSPSGSGRWMSCPASIKMLRELMETQPKGEEKSNFYAQEGTCAHELASESLDNNRTAASYIGNKFNGIEVDKEMAIQTQKYIDYVDGQATWDSITWVETKFSMQFIQKDMFGTADAVIFNDDFIEIIDLKYGKGIVVEATNNSQLAIYAAGVLDYLELNGVTIKDKEIRLTIVQPRAPHSEGPIRTVIMSSDEMDTFIADATKAATLAEEDNPPFGPSEKACQWCEIGPFCKPHADNNLKIAQLEFADFKKPKKEFAGSLLEANSLSDEVISDILQHTKAIEKWAKSIAEYAIKRSKDGHKIPGYKLVYGRSNRAWESPEKLLELFEELNIPSVDRYNVKLKSPAQMEKIVTAESWESLNELVFKPTGSLTIALESDARQAVSTNDEAAKEWS